MTEGGSASYIKEEVGRFRLCVKLDRAVWGGVEPVTPMWNMLIIIITTRRYLMSACTADMDK